MQHLCPLALCAEIKPLYIAVSLNPINEHHNQNKILSEAKSESNLTANLPQQTLEFAQNEERTKSVDPIDLL